jgi:hypothetical protein
MIIALPSAEASVATVNIASELTSERIMHGAKMSRNLRVSKASIQVSVNISFRGWEFRCKSVNAAERLLK